MLVVQPIASDIDDSCEWYLGFDVCRRNTRQPIYVEQGNPE